MTPSEMVPYHYDEVRGFKKPCAEHRMNQVHKEPQEKRVFTQKVTQAQPGSLRAFAS